MIDRGQHGGAHALRQHSRPEVRQDECGDSDKDQLQAVLRHNARFRHPHRQQGSCLFLAFVEPQAQHQRQNSSDQHKGRNRGGVHDAANPVNRAGDPGKVLGRAAQLVTAPVNVFGSGGFHHVVKVGALFHKEVRVLIDFGCGRDVVQGPGRVQVGEHGVREQLVARYRPVGVRPGHESDDFGGDFISRVVLVIGVIRVALELQFAADSQVIGFRQVLVDDGFVFVLGVQVATRHQLQRPGAKIIVHLGVVDSPHVHGVAELGFFRFVIVLTVELLGFGVHQVSGDILAGDVVLYPVHPGNLFNIRGLYVPRTSRGASVELGIVPQHEALSGFRVDFSRGGVSSTGHRVSRHQHRRHRQEYSENNDSFDSFPGDVTPGSSYERQ